MATEHVPVTAETVTDEQIREFNASLGIEMANVTGAKWVALADMRGYCAVALGISRSPRRGLRVGERYLDGLPDLGTTLTPTPARRLPTPEIPALDDLLDLLHRATLPWHGQVEQEMTAEELHQIGEGASMEIDRLQRENEQLKRRVDHVEIAGMLDRQLRTNPPGPPDRDVETDLVDQDAVVVDVTPLTPDEIAASVRARRLFALPGRDPLVALADLCREWVEIAQVSSHGGAGDIYKSILRQDALEIAIKKASAK